MLEPRCMSVRLWRRKSAACVGTADFEAGGWEGRRRARLRKNCGHSYVLGRAGQLFTPLGRYAALSPSSLIFPGKIFEKDNF